MKKILIAGAGGYVGKNLAEALKGKAEVAGVDVAPGFVKPDELKSLEGPYDVFYNLAWIGKGGAHLFWRFQDGENDAVASKSIYF